MAGSAGMHTGWQVDQLMTYKETGGSVLHSTLTGVVFPKGPDVTPGQDPEPF